MSIPCPTCAEHVTNVDEHFAVCPIFSSAGKRAGKRQRLSQRQLLLYLIAERGDQCGICLKPLGPLAECNIDHIIPLSRGGTNAWSNLQPAHITCNGAKGNESTDLQPSSIDPIISSGT